MPKKNEMSANANNSNVQSPLFANDIATALTKESTESQIKLYFQAVLSLSKLNTPFPVNLDDVWPLAFLRKDFAVRNLRKNFIEGVDYQVSLQKEENPKGGRPIESYMLSIPCLEYFIARKVRPVFEVYRKVFHHVAKVTTYTQKEMDNATRTLSKQLRKLEEELKIEKSRTKAAERIKAQESDLKNSCFFFLINNRLYDKWHKYHIQREQERIFNELENRRKELEELPYDLPFYD